MLLPRRVVLVCLLARAFNAAATRLPTHPPTHDLKGVIIVMIIDVT